MRRQFVALLVLTGIVSACRVRADDTQLRQEADRALRKATDFFAGQVSCEGGYLWRYSEDLSRREGEGKASETTVWVQPPGTPSVGMALLDAYRNTGAAYLLEAARKAGYCLVRGQLESGGWITGSNSTPKDANDTPTASTPARKADATATRARWTTTPRRLPCGC